MIGLGSDKKKSGTLRGCKETYNWMKYEESEGFRHNLTYPLAVNELYNRCCTVGSNGKEKELVGRFLKCYVKAEVIGLEIDLSPGVICIALLPEPPAPVLSPSLHRDRHHHTNHHLKRTFFSFFKVLWKRPIKAGYSGSLPWTVACGQFSWGRSHSLTVTNRSVAVRSPSVIDLFKLSSREELDRLVEARSLVKSSSAWDCWSVRQPLPRG